MFVGQSITVSQKSIQISDWSGIDYITQTGLQFAISLPQPPECWDHELIPLDLTKIFFPLVLSQIYLLWNKRSHLYEGKYADNYLNVFF